MPRRKLTWVGVSKWQGGVYLVLTSRHFCGAESGAWSLGDFPSDRTSSGICTPMYSSIHRTRTGYRRRRCIPFYPQGFPAAINVSEFVAHAQNNTDCRRRDISCYDYARFRVVIMDVIRAILALECEIGLGMKCSNSQCLEDISLDQN